MNAKKLKAKILDLDFDHLFTIIEKSKFKKDIIKKIILQENISHINYELYFEDFDKLRSYPLEFRNSCRAFINDLIENTAYNDLQDFCNLFNEN